MESKKEKPDDFELRQRAEKKLAMEVINGEPFSEMSPEKTAKIIHELQVHQIELKMQNDELRRISEELEETRDRYFHLYDFAPNGYFTVTEKWFINEANLTIASMLGSTREELIGKPLTQFVLKGDQDILYKLRQLLLETDAPQSCELRLLKKDGNAFSARLECLIIKDQENEEDGLRQIRVAVSDITEKKNMEESLRQSQKMESLGTLTGGIAHDFNNILGIILGNTELALRDVPEWTPVYSNLEAIKIASIRAKNIVLQLLSFSRKGEQELQQVEIALVIKDALRFLRSTIPTTIDVQQDIFANDEKILADRTQISQIMMNLCINASQAMEQTGGVLTVNLEKVILDDKSAKCFPGLKSGKYIKIIVKDTGPGIKHEITDRIFDPYFTTKEVGKGSGMGLAIVQGLVQNNNGAIFVDSIPGKGTVFTILFPVVDDKSKVESETAEEFFYGGETILFVDDEPSIVIMVKTMLERLGYRVETEINPKTALELFGSKPDQFDLVISDMTMPQMNGTIFAERIMEIRPDMPVIVCTGYSTLINEEMAKLLGIAAYVMKPIMMTELSKTIRMVLDEAKGKS